MTKITTVEKLIEKLNRLPRLQESCLQIMQSVDIPSEEFEKFYSWDKDNHTRNVVCRTSDYELIIACWEKGQGSKIHDYDSKEAWVHPLMGLVKEEKFRLSKVGLGLEKVSSVLLSPEDFSYLDTPGGIHRYTNMSEGRSASLHLYADPVDKWTIYDETTGETTEVITPYDTISGKHVDSVV